jgi:hypothetical protein
MRRDGSRQSVVLVLQESPNYHEGGSPIASGIHVALRETRSDVPTYPIIDSISCDDGLAHGPVPTFSASRSAPSYKRATICLGSGQLCTGAGFPKLTLWRLTLPVAAMPKRTAAQGRVGPVSQTR